MLASITDMFTGAKGKKEAAAKLSFQDVIEAHQKWKKRLFAMISGESEELHTVDVEKVACDDQCALGQWIHGIAADHFSDDGIYVRLKQEHAEFHKRAAEVINHVRVNRTTYSKVILDGPFTQHSNEVIGALNQLQEKYHKI